MGKQIVQKKITDFYKPIKSSVSKYKYIFKDYNSEIDDNYCLVCGISMGPHNPRQLCGKTWCTNE